MSRSRRPASSTRNQRPSRAAKQRDFWVSRATVEPVENVTASPDPSAMVRSLGPPPLSGKEGVAEHYFAAVYDKAAGVAIALAAADGLLDLSEPT